jgi:hypothetical protein
MPENKTRLDPWTFGELHPSGMSHVTQPRAQPAGLAHPPRPARATRQASLPTRPCWGAPAGCRQMWGWLSRCLPSPLTAWLAGINGGLPRRPPPTLASSLTATTTTLPRWAGLCGPRSRRRHTRPPARPDTPRSLLGLLAGTAHTGSTTRTYSTRIQPPPTRFGAISARRGSGRRRRQRSRHQRPFTLSHSHWRWRAWLRRCRLAHAMAARALRLRILSCFEIRRPGPRRGSRACCLQDVVQQAAQAGER